MESLGLADAIERVGDALLEMDVVSKHNLLGLLTSAQVPVVMKSKLIYALTTVSVPPADVSPSTLNLFSFPLLVWKDVLCVLTA